MPRKQLMLKEYLELDWTAEPDGAAFHSDGASSTVRCLLEEELRRGRDCGRRKLPRSRSMLVLTRISSAALSAIRLLTLVADKSAGRGRRPRPEDLLAARSLSMRFRPGVFWKARRKEEEEEESMAAPPTSFEEEKAINEGSSFSFPSAVVSSRSSVSESDFVSISVPSSARSSSSDVDISASAGGAAPGDVKEDDIPSTPNSVDKDAGASAAVDRCEESPAPECQSSEESEQLSPVSVMDFPSETAAEEEEEEEEEEDEEEGENSTASFDQSLAKLERTKLQLLQKIRRFECLADLDPVDLHRQFTFSDEDEEEDGDDETAVASQEKKAWDLLRELKAGCRRGDLHGGVGVEKLLLDFFVDGLSCSDGVKLVLLEAAMEWLEGRQPGKLDEYEEEVSLREMEREGGRWRFALKEEVGVEVGGLLLGALVEEMVAELVR